jgi:hypothetical protein
VSGIERFEIRDGDVGGMLEVYRRIVRLAEEVVAELKNRGFSVDSVLPYIVKREEAVIVKRREVATSTEVEVRLWVFTRDGKRYSIPLARFAGCSTSRAISAEVYSAERAISEMREI